MAVEYVQKGQSKPQGVPKSEAKFPAYNVLDSLAVADVIHKHGGGSAEPEHLSSYLGYKGTNNGAFLGRVSAARAFGFIEKVGAGFVPSALARLILTPVYDIDAKKALVQAFFNIPLYKRIYDDFRGQELPPGFGMKNALKLKYGIVPNRVDLAYKVLMESAEQAGFFQTRAGARTHLIIPAISSGNIAPIAPVKSDANDAHSGGGGGDGGGGDGSGGDDAKRNENAIRRLREGSGSNLGDVKAQYVTTLIKLFEDKSAKGDLDEKLMERIERLLGAS